MSDFLCGLDAGVYDSSINCCTLNLFYQAMMLFGAVANSTDNPEE